MDWRHDYVDGNVRSSCSICGRSRRFPENLTFCDDKLFRCESCMEKTALAFDREIAAARQRREQPDVAIGIRPPWESADSLLTIATERAAHLLPGFTPTSTFSDTFDTVPGGVGSDWAATGTVTETDSGVARMVAAAGGSAVIDRTGFTRSSALANLWYSIVRFSIQSTPDSKSYLLIGWDGVIDPNLFFGVNADVSHTRFSFGLDFNRMVVTDTLVDTDTHTCELWSKGDGYIRAALDRGLPMATAPGASVSTIYPQIVVQELAGGTSQRLDLYDAVYFK